MEDKLIQDSEKLEITDLLLTEEERKNVKELFEILQVFHDVTLEFQAMDFNLKQAYILSKRLAEDFPEVSGYLDPSKWSTFQLAISYVKKDCQRKNETFRKTKIVSANIEKAKDYLRRASLFTLRRRAKQP